MLIAPEAGKGGLGATLSGWMMVGVPLIEHLFSLLGEPTKRNSIPRGKTNRAESDKVGLDPSLSNLFAIAPAPQSTRTLA